MQVVDDPIYLDEPYVLSITYSYDPNAGPATENCSGNPYAENGGTDRHHVPHFLPGQNNAIGEFIKAENWIPFEPIRGGVKTIYPEYRAVLNKTATTESITVPVSKSANDEKKAIADQSPHGRRAIVVRRVRQHSRRGVRIRGPRLLRPGGVCPGDRIERTRGVARLLEFLQ